MRYIAKKEYKRYSKVGNTLLWRCENGDKIDVERVGNSNLIKIINRNEKCDAIFDEMFININDYDQFKNGYLKSIK